MVIFHSYVNLPEGTKWGWVKTYDWLVVTGTMEWIMTFHRLGFSEPQLTFTP